MNRIEMNNEMLAKVAPSIFASNPIKDVSARYQFIPTIDIVNSFRDAGWIPVAARQSSVRTIDRQGFQTHVINFSRKDLPEVKGARVEIMLKNSHDKGSAFCLSTAVFRQICSNGLCVSNKSLEFSHRHSGAIQEELIDSASKIFDGANMVAGRIEDFSTIVLTPDERGVFAQAAASLLWDDENRSFDHSQLLNERRYDDQGKDLWTTTNVIQENIMKGGIRGRSNKGRRTKTRAIKNIEKDIKINKAIWMLAEKMAELKK